MRDCIMQVSSLVNWTRQSKQNKKQVTLLFSPFSLLWIFVLQNVYFLLIKLCKFTSKVIMFWESLQLQETIAFYHSKQIGPKVIGHVSFALTWHISLIIINILFLVVITCILSQSKVISCWVMPWMHSYPWA
jgi:hypothetical protein